jgi:hypothetical protein
VALIGLLAVFIFGSTDPGEPVAQIGGLLLALFIPAAARARESRARTPARP